MDYKLFPIPLADINRPVYYMIKSALLRNCKKLPEDALQEEWLQLREHLGKGNLVFPSADYTQTYDSKTLKIEVIMIESRQESFSYITVDGKRIPYKPVPKTYESTYNSYWIGYDDDDEVEEDPGPKVEWETVYHETHYSIGVNPETGRYQVVTSTDDFTYHPPYPWPRYNWEEVVQAIDRLLPVVAGTYLPRGQWAERLEMTRDMLVEKVNELHILHNGGLYDNHVLARLLTDSVLRPDAWQPLFKEYVESLKRFAMSVVTLRWGGDPNTPLSLFLKQNKVVPEWEKKAVAKERLRREGTITDIDVLKPVSKPKWLEMYEQEQREKPQELEEKPQEPEKIQDLGLYCPPLPADIPDIPEIPEADPDSGIADRENISREKVSRDEKRADRNAAIRDECSGLRRYPWWR